MSQVPDEGCVMAVRAAREDDQAGRSPCWCCGSVEDPDRLVRLGNHPEVGVCTRCAHSISKWAREIEDRTRTGVAVRVRDRFRRVRRTVVRRGWHRNRFIGGPLRWFGRFTP